MKPTSAQKHQIIIINFYQIKPAIFPLAASSGESCSYSYRYSYISSVSRSVVFPSISLDGLGAGQESIIFVKPSSSGML